MVGLPDPRHFHAATMTSRAIWPCFIHVVPRRTVCLLRKLVIRLLQRCLGSDNAIGLHLDQHTVENWNSWLSLSTCFLSLEIPKGILFATIDSYTLSSLQREEQCKQSTHSTRDTNVQLVRDSYSEII